MAQEEEKKNEAIISMAIEAWRFSKLFGRVLQKLDAGESRRYQSQFSWFLKKTSENLESVGLKMVNVEGSKFEPGLPITPVNIGDFQQGDDLVIDQMLEPIITSESGLVKAGTATLRKVGS